MKTILVWLLISVSEGAYNRGNVTVLERFADVQNCEAVRKAIPNPYGDSHRMRCIQANVVVAK